MKKCSKCGAEKPLSEFHQHKQNNGKDKLRPECIPCYRKSSREQYVKHRDKILERTRKYNKDAHRMEWMREYRARKLREQRESLATRPRPSSCEVCARQGKVVWDHDHKTGLFRGWLCNQCNSALGWVNDNTTTMRLLIKYLEDNEQSS